MNAIIKSANTRAIKTSREWHEINVLAEELELKLCYPENFAVLKMIVQMKQQPCNQPKTNTMNNEEYIMQRISEITGMSVAVAKLMVYATITVLGVGVLVVMKSNNIF